jgi:hypothetical protein
VTERTHRDRGETVSQRLLLKIRAGKRISYAEMLAACPYRTLLGWCGVDAAEMMERIGGAIAVIGGQPEPLAAAQMATAVEMLQRGRVVLLISDRGDLRDYAKREILAMLEPAAGRA